MAEPVSRNSFRGLHSPLLYLVKIRSRRYHWKRKNRFGQPQTLMNGQTSVWSYFYSHIRCKQARSFFLLPVSHLCDHSLYIDIHKGAFCNPFIDVVV
jgi:serine acetyltransferase